MAREFGLSPFDLYDAPYARVLDVFYGVADLERFDKARNAVLAAEIVGGIAVAVRGGDVGKWEGALMERVGLVEPKRDIVAAARRMAAKLEGAPEVGSPEPLA